MATVFSFGPFSALYFMIYENLKTLSPGTPSFYESMFYSSVAGCLASILTNPLDMSKLRMQLQRSGQYQQLEEVSFGYRNMFHGVYLICKKEGFLALYKGISNYNLIFVVRFTCQMFVSHSLYCYYHEFFRNDQS